MTRAIRLRRAFVAMLILTAITAALPFSQASASTTEESTYSYVSRTICPIDWREGRWHVKQLIRCTAAHWNVDADRALAIAKRESGFQPTAFNGWSCAKGIFQHLCRYWPDRALDYGFRDYSAYNARANIIVTMKMVKRYGWSPWSS